jgi:hypothetical protein
MLDDGYMYDDVDSADINEVFKDSILLCKEVLLL